jgi:hypothetical protein
LGFSFFGGVFIIYRLGTKTIIFSREAAKTQRV